MTELTKADAAKLFTDPVLIVEHDADGNPVLEKISDDRMVYRTKKVPVSADTILDFRVRGDQVTIVTIDGQKLTAPLSPAKRRA